MTSAPAAPPVERQAFSTRQKLIAAASLVLFFVLGAITAYQMRPWVDEAWYGAPGLTLVNHGYFGSPSFNGAVYGLKDLDRFSYWVMPMLPLSQAAWDLVFPQTLHSIRLVSTLSGVAAILCWAAFFFRLSGSSASTVFFFLLASCDYVLTSAAGFGRPDMMAFLFQSAAFASYALLRKRRLGAAILVSQTCVVLSGLTHPNGGMLSFIGMLFLTLYLDRARIRLPHFLLAATPYVLGGLGWGLYILQDPSAFFAQYGYQTTGRFTGFAHPWNAISREITDRYMPQMGFTAKFYPPKALAFSADFVAIILILRNPKLRSQLAPRVFLGIVSLYLVFYIFLEQTKEDYYFAYLSTFYTALLAFYLGYLWEARPRLRQPVALIIAGIMAVGAAGPVLKLRHNPWADYAATARWLQTHAAPFDRIAGSYELGFFLGFTPRFLDDCEFGITNGVIPDFILMDPIYDGRMAEQRGKSEAKYRQLQARLSQYREVYRRGEYRVLMRNSHAPVG